MKIIPSLPINHSGVRWACVTSSKEYGYGVFSWHEEKWKAEHNAEITQGKAVEVIMGNFYSMHGEIRVRPCPEVEEIVRRFNEKAGDDLTAQFDEDRVLIVGGSYMSYTRTEILDSIVKELGQYALAARVIEWNSDGYRGDLYVGLVDGEREYLMSDYVMQVQDEQGWTDDTIMMFALRFITKKGLDDEFDKYIQQMADDEDEECLS